MAGVPIQFLQLPPRLVTRETTGQNQIDYYTLQWNGGKKELKREDVIDFRYPNPEKMTSGLPIISTVMDSITVNKFQMEYSKRFYEQGGFIGALFSTTKELTNQVFNRTLQMLKDNYTGIERSYKIGLFDNDLKPIPAAYSIKDMEITNQRKLTKEDILEAFKVSKILIGQGESINRATAEASIFQFTSGIIDPILSYIDAVLTMNVQMDFKDKTLFVKHDTLAPRDQKASLDYYKDGLNDGWLSINDVRRAESLNPLDKELADAYTINVGGSAIRVDTGEQIGKEEAKQFKLKALDNRDILWRQFDARHSKEVGIFEREMFSYTEDQRERFLKKLEGQKSSIFAVNLFDEEEDNLLFILLRNRVINLLMMGYSLVMMQQRLEAELNMTLVVGDVERIVEKAMFFNIVTRRLVNKIEARTKDEFKNKLNGLYDDMGNRINSLVVTTTTGALNAGIWYGLKDAGLMIKTWLTMRDARVRATEEENHLVMDGVSIGIDMPFEVPSRSGTDLMMYPGDVSGSPENLVNDRCTIIGS